MVEEQTKMAQMIASDAYWAEPRDAEWRDAWHGLRAMGYDIDAADPQSGESWQYMGTWPTGERYQSPAGISRPCMVHQFRHRSLRGERKYVNVPAKQF